MMKKIAPSTYIHTNERKIGLVNIVKLLSSCGQSYKAPTIVIYVSRVVNISHLLVTTTIES